MPHIQTLYDAIVTSLDNIEATHNWDEVEGQIERLRRLIERLPEETRALVVELDGRELY